MLSNIEILVFCSFITISFNYYYYNFIISQLANLNNTTNIYKVHSKYIVVHVKNPRRMWLPAALQEHLHAVRLLILSPESTTRLVEELPMLNQRAISALQIP